MYRAKRAKPAEYSKQVLAAVMLTYFFGVLYGAFAVWRDPTQLYAYLAYIGTPTSVALGWYYGKAKAENVLKIGGMIHDNGSSDSSEH